MSRFFRNLIPGLNKSSSKDCDGWRDKLIGKVIINDSEQTTLKADECFYAKDLPSPNRVITPDSVYTTDHRPERLNVHVDDTMRVTSVRYG